MCWKISLVLSAALVSGALGNLVEAEQKTTEPRPQLLLQFDDDDGTPADASGQEHQITNHAAKAGVPGRFGKAYDFDGASSYLDAGDNYGITFAFPAQTIEFWVNPASVGTEACIMGSQEEPTGGSWRWNFTRGADGMISFNIWDGEQEPKARKVTSKTTASPGRWTHVAVTLDAGVAQKTRLFVNGREEATDSLKLVAPYGSLFIGCGRAGPFAGRIDGLAIYDTVLSDEVIADHASGRAPIPDGMSLAARGPGFRIFPVDATAKVGIRHSAFPGKSWNLRIPEYAYRDPETGVSVAPSEIAWVRLEDGKLTFHWNAPDEVKKERRLDYWGWLKPGPDVIEYELTGKNVGDKAWGEKPWGGVLSLICLSARGNPAFHDYEAMRTYVRKDGRWITMNEIVKGKFKPHRMCGLIIKSEERPGPDRIAAKVSADGKWVMGIATDTAASLSFNLQLRASCMHSNPGWPPLKPGEQASAKGKIYLLKGGLDDLWKRYKKDFPQ